MVCNHDKMVVEVKQDECRGFDFTLTTTSYNRETEEDEITPVDLTDSTILFEIKKAPYFNIPPIVKKEITTDSDRDIVGIISSPEDGQFTVQINQDDTHFPPNDYYLIVKLLQEGNTIIISGEGNTSSIFRICKQ